MNPKPKALSVPTRSCVLVRSKCVGCQGSSSTWLSVLRYSLPDRHRPVLETESDGVRSFEEVDCQLCVKDSLPDACKSDVYHLFCCGHPSSVLARSALVSQIVDCVKRAGCSDAWCLAHESCPLMLVLKSLFGVDDPTQRLRIAFGCFSDNELSSAMAQARISDSAKWPLVSRDLRRLLVGYAHAEWSLRIPRSAA